MMFCDFSYEFPMSFHEFLYFLIRLYIFICFTMFCVFSDMYFLWFSNDFHMIFVIFCVFLYFHILLPGFFDIQNPLGCRILFVSYITPLGTPNYWICGLGGLGGWTIRKLVDRGGGILDFQHCIVITRGHEERIPKTASVVGTSIGLRSFLLWLYMFFDIFCVFLCFS